MDATTAIKRTLAVSRILGLSQLIWDNKPEIAKYGISKWFTGYSSVVMCAFLIAPSLQLIVIQLWNVSNVTQKVGFIYWSVMNPFACLLAIGLGIRQQNSFKDVINVLLSCINEISSLAGCITFKSTTGYLAAAAVASFVVVICDYSTWCWSMLSEYLATIFGIVVVTHIGIYILILSATFHQLNEGLAKGLQTAFLPDKQKKLAWEVHAIAGEAGVNDDVLKQLSQEPESVVHRYRVLYHELYEISLNLCDVFATTTICMTGHMVIVLIVATHSTVTSYDDIKTLDLNCIDITLGWTIYSFSAILLIIYPCSTAMVQGMKITTTVNRYLASSVNPLITQELLRFSILLQHEKVNFSPHGMISLSYSLLLTIAGSVISYLVILSQISKNDTSR